ncbi:MAG: metallophosphoesterase family protein [Mycoplasmatales bacterium]
MKNKILIVSDNHGIDNISSLKEQEACLYAFHSGDSQFPYVAETMKNFELKVKGNCDYDQTYPEADTLTIPNLGKTYITHGHLTGVKYSLNTLKKYCQKNQINICIYGHTHVVDIQYQQEQDLLIINPGSSTQSRSEYPQTYVVLTYDTEEYEVQIKNIKNNQELKKVKYLRNKVEKK